METARAGNLDAALAELAALAGEAPEDKTILADRIVVLTWAKRREEALDLSGRVNAYTFPIHAVYALARAARDLGRHPQALWLYDALLSRRPDALDAALGRALTLADAGRNTEAAAALDAIFHRAPQNREVLRAMAYAAERAGDWANAALAHTRLLAIDQQDGAAARGRIMAVANMGAPHLALTLADERPELLKPEERRRLLGDRAAAAIRWGEQEPLERARRYADTDRALADLDAACACDWDAVDPGDAARRRLVFDRMVALRDRSRMREVIAHHRRLAAAGIPLPPYVLLAAGDAYLYEREPEPALVLYQQADALQPQNFETRLSLFYALVELDRFHEALAVIDALAAGQPAWRQRRGSRVYRTNPPRFRADLAAALGRAYAEDLAGAERRLTAMADLAPANTDIRREVATVWRWRGLPARAERAYEQVLTREPDQAGAAIGLAAAHFDLRDWARAGTQIAALEAAHPEDLPVQRLARGWWLHNRPEIYVEGRGGESSGGTFGAESQGGEAWLYSAPLQERYRAFLHTQVDRAVFTEGTGEAYRPGAGVEYRDRDWRLSGELGEGLGDNTDPMLALAAARRLGDRWNLDGALELNSAQMPLRGQRAGVRGHLFSLGATYRWHESQRLAAGYSVVDMDDGNLRQSLSANFERRLIGLPSYTLNARIEAYASDNTEDNVIYYNPDSDAALSLTFDNRWRLYRRYEREFAHRLQAELGRYWQEHEASATLWSLRYEQQLKLNDRVELVYGVARSRRVYDGDPEYQLEWFGHLNVHL